MDKIQKYRKENEAEKRISHSDRVKRELGKMVRNFVESGGVVDDKWSKYFEKDVGRPKRTK